MDQQNIYCAFNGAEDAEPQEFRDGFKVSSFVPSCWYTSIGASLKKKEILSKGFPNVKNWRFVTMTLNRELFADSQQAYEYVNERMRYFFRDLRKTYGKFKYCWKLEFHEDGWPHWHALIEIKKPVDLDRWRDTWGFGRIEVKRADKNAQEYLFKYITKSGLLPEWVLDYGRRMRFWQTSPKFYTGEKKPVTQKKGERKCQTTIRKQTIRQKLSRWEKTALISSSRLSKRIYRKVNLTVEFHRLWNSLVTLRLSDFTQEISFLNPWSLSVTQTSIGCLAQFLETPYSELGQ